MEFWSENVVVIPAYNDGYIPFGAANGISLHTWSGWATYGDFDDDIGLIALDRPVGALAGWLGFGFENNCYFFTTEDFVHNGYPAESPYNGERMYTQGGNYDGCQFNMGGWYGEQLSYARYLYGGQSGTGSANDDYVLAVVSNGNLYISNDVRINPTKFIDLNTWIDEDHPSTYDLIPLGVTASPTNITAGEAFSSMSFVVFNNADVPWSGTTGYSIYLSTDNTISTGDTLIGTGSFEYSFSAKSRVTVHHITPAIIPVSIMGGTYYVGVIINNSDYNPSNNYSDGWDAAKVTVNSAYFTLSASTTGTGSGTITGTGISCPGDCSESFVYGTSVTLSATPATGSDFTGWSGACSGTGSCTVSMTAARSVTATFALQTRTLHVGLEGTGNGTVIGEGINCPGDCSQDYAIGANVTITAIPAIDSSLAAGAEIAAVQALAL